VRRRGVRGGGEREAAPPGSSRALPSRRRIGHSKHVRRHVTVAKSGALRVSWALPNRCATVGVTKLGVLHVSRALRSRRASHFQARKRLSLPLSALCVSRALPNRRA
jgi:hypothetical protein